MMKKLLYGFAIIAGFTSCNDDYTDWSSPQSNTPEEAAEKLTLTVQSTVSAIDFATETAESIQLFTTNLQEGQVEEYILTLSAEDKEETSVVTATPSGSVVATDLQDAVAAIYGKAPIERTLNVSVLANVHITTPSGTIVTEKRGSFSLQAKLNAPTIESEYYLIGSLTGWTALDNSLKFNHSGKDVYDDPIFTLVVAAPVDETTGERVDLWFKIAPKSAYDGDEDHFWASLLGGETNGDESLEAALKIGGESFKQPATDEAKFYSITLNMMDYTMTIAPLAFDEFIYVPGNHQGWKPESAPALQSLNFDGIYTGYSYLDGDFKFTKVRDWDHEEYNWNDFSEVNELFAQGGGSNINISTPGFYQITANIQTSSLDVVATTWGIIGDATPGGWDSDTQMTYEPSDESWSVTADLKSGGFKFRANGDWDINYGGSIENLSIDGNNLSIEADGSYTIKLYLTRSTSTSIYCTVTKN